MDCHECGFRPDLWTDGDLLTTLAAAQALAAGVLLGASDAPELYRLLAPLSSLPPDDPAAVHLVMHQLHLAGRWRHSGTPTAVGRVVQLSRGDGGVPKVALEQVTVGWSGLDGDTQADRQHHGRPWQAVCLWSAEVIEGLQAEGHPIGFGSAGENVTVRGLDWASLSPGVRLLAGTALLQVSSQAIPCSKNAQWFSDGGFRRMSHQVRPGASRLYAAVVTPGSLATGDAVVVEPD